MANTVNNVTAGKPKKSGAMFTAPIGTQLPTTANEALDNAFKCMGYISDDGLTNSNSPESDTVKAWGGDPVLCLQNEREDKFKFTAIEAMNTEVLKVVYGADNVVGDLANGIAISANSDESEVKSFVIDMIYTSNVMKRVVIPAGKVTSIGDVNYKDDDAVGYEIELTCLPDETGNTHYEYIKAAA